ncbi:MAG: hypothetical protein SNJ70_10375, partial [Armatimonadota bacterium]
MEFDNKHNPDDRNTYEKDTEQQEYSFDKLVDEYYYWIHLNGLNFIVDSIDELPFCSTIDDITYIFGLSFYRNIEKDNKIQQQYIFHDSMALFSDSNPLDAISMFHSHLHNEKHPAIHIGGVEIYCLLGFYVTEPIFYEFRERFSLSGPDKDLYSFDSLNALHAQYKDYLKNKFNISYTSKEIEYYKHYYTLTEHNINTFLDFFNSSV